MIDRPGGGGLPDRHPEHPAEGNYVILPLLVGCTLRRNELAEVDVETIQQRKGAVGS